MQESGTGGLGEWTLNGYSGGAQATGWPAELRPSHAPDVKLAGFTMGGTPADPGAVTRSLDGGLFSGFEAAAAVSLDAEFPGADVQKLLDDKVRQATADARGKCVTDLLTGFAFKKLADHSIVPALCRCRRWRRC